MNIKSLFIRDKDEWDIELHKRNLRDQFKHPEWESLNTEIESLILKKYSQYDKCKTLDDFIKNQAEISGLSQIIGMKNKFKHNQ